MLNNYPPINNEICIKQGGDHCGSKFKIICIQVISRIPIEWIILLCSSFWNQNIIEWTIYLRNNKLALKTFQNSNKEASRINMAVSIFFSTIVQSTLNLGQIFKECYLYIFTPKERHRYLLSNTSYVMIYSCTIV